MFSVTVETRWTSTKENEMIKQVILAKQIRLVERNLCTKRLS